MDLQSDDFYSNIIFRKFEVGSYQRAGLQLISHVFQPQTEDHAGDEVCTPLYDPGDGVDEDGHHMTADTDGIAHMAHVQVDRNETIVEICQAFGEVKAADDVKQAVQTKALVAPSSTKMSTPKISTPGLSSYGASVVTNARRGGAPPWMSNGGRFAGIGSISNLPGLGALGSSNNNPSPSTSNTDGSQTDGNNGSTAGSSKDEVEGESTVVMYPRMYLRTSDDVLRMQLVTLTLQLMNEVWRRHWSIDPLSAPFILTYDCVATGASKGLVQLIPKESRHINTAMDDPIMIDQLIRSTAGAVTSGYVLGIHHSDLAMRDGCTAFWRPSSSAVATNFGPPVPGGGGGGGGAGGPHAGSFPGLFDTSATSPDLNHALGVTTGLPKHVKTALKQLQAWDIFRRLCIQAFVVLRNAWRNVFEPVVVPMFVKCGIPQRQIEMYVHGKHSLYLTERDDLQAQLYFRKCIS